MSVPITITLINPPGGSGIPSTGTSVQFFPIGVNVTTAVPLDTQPVVNGVVTSSLITIYNAYQLVFVGNTLFTGPYTVNVTALNVGLPLFPSPSFTNQTEPRAIVDVVTFQNISFAGGRLMGTLFSSSQNTANGTALVGDALTISASGILSLIVPALPNGYNAWQFKVRGAITGTMASSGAISIWAEAPNTTLATVPASSINEDAAPILAQGPVNTYIQSIDTELFFIGSANTNGVYNFSIRPINFVGNPTVAYFTMSLIPI